MKVKNNLVGYSSLQSGDFSFSLSYSPAAFNQELEFQEEEKKTASKLDNQSTEIVLVFPFQIYAELFLS